MAQLPTYTLTASQKDHYLLKAFFQITQRLHTELHDSPISFYERMGEGLALMQAELNEKED